MFEFEGQTDISLEEITVVAGFERQLDFTRLDDYISDTQWIKKLVEEDCRSTVDLLKGCCGKGCSL